jgi:hypothetical protein
MIIGFALSFLAIAGRSLVSTTIDNGRLEIQLDLASATASCLKIFDDLHALLISHFTEDDMLAIKP